MSTFRKLLVVVFGALLFLAGLIAVFYLPFEAFLMNPDTYRSGFHSQKVYARSADWVGEVLSRQSLPAGQGNQMEMARYALAAFRSEDYTALVRILAPESYIQQLSDTAIGNVFDYLNKRSRELRVEIDLRPVKTRMSGSTAEEVIKLVFSTFPPCKADDLLKLPLPGQKADPAKLPYCQPPVVMQPLITPLLVGEVGKYATMIPDKFIVTDEVLPPSFIRAVNVFWNLRGGLGIISLASIGLILILVLLCFFPTTSLKPVGVPLIVTGIVSILLVTILAVVATPAVESISPTSSAVELKFIPELIKVFTGIFSTYFFWVAVIGVVVTGVGIILTFVIKPAQNQGWSQPGFQPIQ